MATFTQTSNLGGEASVEFTYDDATMKMAGVKLVNNSKQYLYIFMISPLSLSVKIDPGINITRPFLTAERPSWNYREVTRSATPEKIIDGIQWRACLGE